MEGINRAKNQALKGQSPADQANSNYNIIIVENKSHGEKLFVAFLSLLGTILLTISISFIGSSAAPLALEFQTSDYSQPFLPFYTSMVLISLFIFAATLICHFVSSLIRYFRFGVFGHNNFYNEHDMLKIGSVFLTLLSGQLFSLGLMAIFYVMHELKQANLCSAIASSLLSVMAVFILIACYFGFGTKVSPM